jgi:hypothetical protein
MENRGIKLTDITVGRDNSLISAHSAVQHQMGYMNVLAHLVPKILTDYYNARLMELSVIPMTRYYDQGQQCLQFHITDDERWVDNATPENPAKKESMTWKHPSFLPANTLKKNIRKEYLGNCLGP